MVKRMRAYSIDLRKKVISFIKSGKSQKLATELFNLNKATVNRWWLRYKKEGQVNPRKNLGSNPKVDIMLLIKYIENNPEFI
jgi:transposase